MKKVLFMALVGILICMAIFAGCAKEAPAPTPSPTPAPEKPIELKYSSYAPPVVWFFKDVIYPWTKEVEERSNGRVKITVFPGEALGRVHDHYQMVLSRVADICQIDPGPTPGVFPLTEGIALPLIFKNTESACATWWEMSEKYLMDTEYKEVKLLWCQAIAPTNFRMVKKPVHTLEDLAGMKFACTAEAQVNAIEKLGATPTGVAVTEIYTALERGVVDATLFPWEGMVAFKFMEVTKYSTSIDLLLTPLPVFMNVDAFNSLPPDIQQIIDQTTGFEMSRSFGAQFDVVTEHMLNDVLIPYDQQKGNPEIYYLPDAERERWHEAVTPLYEEWIAEREAKGLPAKAFYEDLLTVAAKYNK